MNSNGKRGLAYAADADFVAAFCVFVAKVGLGPLKTFALSVRLASTKVPEFFVGGRAIEAGPDADLHLIVRTADRLEALDYFLVAGDLLPRTKVLCINSQNLREFAGHRADDVTVVFDRVEQMLSTHTGRIHANAG